MKMQFEGIAILNMGIFTRICSVFINIHTFFRETPKKIAKNMFIETVFERLDPATSTVA